MPFLEKPDQGLDIVFVRTEVDLVDLGPAEDRSPCLCGLRGRLAERLGTPPAPEIEHGALSCLTVFNLNQADGRHLPLCTDCTDVILSTSVFKHVIGLEKLISECHRVLKITGKMIVIDPTPLGVRLGCRLGYFSTQEIRQILDLEATQSTLMSLGFKVLGAERFMLSPVPFRGCDIVERVLKHLHMDRLFLYQVVCAECGLSNCVLT